MSLRYALLALLAEGEAHGYRLMKLFSARLGALWHPNIGQIYQLLRDLERRRLIARRDEPHGTRRRRHFRLTARGERALHAWLARRPGWPAPIRDEILVRFLAAERHGAAAVPAAHRRRDTRRPVAVHAGGLGGGRLADRRRRDRRGSAHDMTPRTAALGAIALGGVAVVAATLAGSNAAFLAFRLSQPRRRKPESSSVQFPGDPVSSLQLLKLGVERLR